MASTDALHDLAGLTEAQLLELYRRMVLLRTYDERSVVYHRQGRIGTYAIFWNHEAIQAGATFALADDDWIFPSYRESAIVRGSGYGETVYRGHDLDRIVVRCDRPLPLQADGEDLGDVDKAVFEARRDAISVLV